MNKEEALTAVRIIVDELPVLDALTIVMDCQSYLTDQYAATLQGAEADAVRSGRRGKGFRKKKHSGISRPRISFRRCHRDGCRGEENHKKTRLTLICSGVTLMINVIALVSQIVIKVLPHL